MKKLFAHKAELSEDQTQKEILSVLLKISDQNERSYNLLERLYNQNERSHGLGERAERAFFAIAAPYYISQFLSHWLGEKYLDTHPMVKEMVMSGSLLFGLAVAFPKAAMNFKNGAQETTRRTYQKGKKVIAIGNALYDTVDLKISLGFQMAGQTLTATARNIPRRCKNKIEKKFERKLQG
jgi:hypothetical protein